MYDLLELTIYDGTAPSADALIKCSEELFIQVFGQTLKLQHAIGQGLELSGDENFIGRMFAISGSR